MARRRKQPEEVTSAFWDQIERDYTLDPAQRMLVVLGRQAWARWDECRRRLDTEGVLIAGSRGRTRLNPLVSAEARSREALLKVLASFNFGE